MTASLRQDDDAIDLLFQNVIPAEVSLVCVVKPDEFWDKKVTHFCFWKEKDRLGFEVSLSYCRYSSGQHDWSNHKSLFVWCGPHLGSSQVMHYLCKLICNTASKGQVCQTLEERRETSLYRSFEITSETKRTGAEHTHTHIDRH